MANSQHTEQTTPHILLLGGTGMALKLARSLLGQQYRVTYSIAGLVRKPTLPCPVVSGGFSQFGGMANFIQTQKINLIIDATHPYAAQISQHAILAAKTCNLPCWRLQRPVWQASAGDCWFEFADWRSLLPALASYRHIFLSHGQLQTAQLTQLIKYRQPDQRFYLRTAARSELNLPDWIKPIQSIGPFEYADELALLQRLRIDALVSKNSGGDMTVAKLQAARTLELPVLLLQRPTLPAADQDFFEIEDILTALQKSCTLAP